MIRKTRRAGISSGMALVLALSSSVLPGCGNAENGKANMEPPGPTRELPEQAQAGFKGQGVDPTLVIVLDRQGRFQTFRGRDTKGTKPIKGVLPAEIDEVIGVTIFKTTNPKYCWTNTLGQEECVEW